MKNHSILISITCVFFLIPIINQAQSGPQEPTKLQVFEQEEFWINDGEAFLKDYLNLSSANSFEKIVKQTDHLGYIHEKYQQYYNGIKVEFGSSVLHSKNGRLASISNNVFPINNLKTDLGLSKEDALESAINFVKAEEYLWENEKEALAGNYVKPEGELVVFPKIENLSERDHIAYKFDIYASKPLYRADIYVDAVTGEVILENVRIHHANEAMVHGNSLYNGDVNIKATNHHGGYQLSQMFNGNGIQTFDMENCSNYSNAVEVISNSPIFVNNPIAVQAHWGAEQAYNYFYQEHSRDSYDNKGGIIKSYVSYKHNFVNAFWDGSRMTYGDGDGKSYGPLVALDIVAHEISHGITEHTAGLIYSYEAGALNESFSDIFGEAIEQFATGNNNWLIGDQISIGANTTALRSMRDPNLYGQADTYKGANWYANTTDNGGVHYNSGVQNFWFYLLTEGGNGTNDYGNSYEINGIGIDKAAKIAYRNLSVYLTANATYHDARSGAIQAARDLYGKNSPEEIAVTNAWNAVGVGEAYVKPAVMQNTQLLSQANTSNLLD
ncbi:M4 family metallopeptidase [Haloflavibacter putidus]|uniref:Neutral metalloproteinase n=1 Tax=Haloflavibacter putidus TaxID=2576776 RepID=A0A507ZY37_9FLAO|nr:M4 family metallopeptidase [Haloflavibacter putidus]TQD40628.1 M4 family metallopeptidase [Haloflavibacter putidus]